MADNTSCMDGAVNTSLQEMCNYLNFISTAVMGCKSHLEML